MLNLIVLNIVVIFIVYVVVLNIGIFMTVQHLIVRILCLIAVW